MWVRWQSSESCDGARTLSLAGLEMPVSILGGSEDIVNYPYPGVYYRRYGVGFGEKLFVKKVTSFIGLDRGDIAEVDIDLEPFDGNRLQGPRVYNRSFHRHKAESFESWGPWVDVSFRADGVIVVLKGRSLRPVVIRAHFGVLLEVRE